MDQLFEKPRYYSGLDLIRFAAASIVMLFHLGWRPWVNGSEMDWTAAELAGEPVWVLASGFVGVQVFFVLSGLVIANSVSARTGALGFARSRFLRLIPAAVICATLSALIAIVVKGMSFPSAAVAWMASATLWPLGGWLDPVYWTLAVELVFYLLIGGWLLIGRPIPLLWIALILQAASTVFIVAWAFDAAPLDRVMSRGLLLWHGTMFAAGILMALRASGEDSKIIVPALVAAIAASVLQIILATPHAELLASLLFLFAIVAMQWAIGWNAPAERFRILGLSTYPLYLIHMPVGGTIIHFSALAGLSYWPALFLGCAVSLLTAIVISCFLEKPLRKELAKAFDALATRVGIRSRASSVKGS